MTSQDHNHDFGPVGVMVSFGLVVLLVATWVVGLLAAGAFLLALLGAATMVLTLSLMTPETASRYVWTWSLSIPLPLKNATCPRKFSTRWTSKKSVG